MKVTKNIREYIERNLNEKCKAAIEKLWSEYEARIDEAFKEAEEITKSANAEVAVMLESKGLELDYRRGQALSLYAGRGRRSVIWDKDEFERLGKIEGKIRADRDKAMWNIIMSLELGETAKEDMQTAIDAITFDGEE